MYDEKQTVSVAPTKATVAVFYIYISRMNNCCVLSCSRFLLVKRQFSLQLLLAQGSNLGFQHISKINWRIYVASVTMYSKTPSPPVISVDFRSGYGHRRVPTRRGSHSANLRRRQEVVWHARRGAALWRKRLASSPLPLAEASTSRSFLRCFARAGFTRQQAEAMVKILLRMTQSNMDVIYGDMVTKMQQVMSPQRCN